MYAKMKFQGKVQKDEKIYSLFAVQEGEANCSVCLLVNGFKIMSPALITHDCHHIKQTKPVLN